MAESTIGGLRRLRTLILRQEHDKIGDWAVNRYGQPSSGTVK